MNDVTKEITAAHGVTLGDMEMKIIGDRASRYPRESANSFEMFLDSATWDNGVYYIIDRWKKTATKYWTYRILGGLFNRGILEVAPEPFVNGGEDVG
jgi:hypothetical protein